MRRWILALCWTILLLLPFALWCDLNFRIRTRHVYFAHESVVEPVCVVHIANLRGMNWGNDNAYLLRKIAAQHPDQICLSGEMYMYGSKSERIIVHSLLNSLQGIAPTRVISAEIAPGLRGTPPEILVIHLSPAE